jgi:hypothetical protein
MIERIIFWSVHNRFFVWAGIVPIAASGTLVVTPPATTTYKLTATNAGGSTLIINITVTVS